MDDPLVECIPNFSEGRRSDVLDSLIQACLSSPGVLLLDRHSDPDHNRSVLTLAGPPQAVLEGVFQAIRCAASLINLDEQRGNHPRLGAADVVPFVPLRGLSLADCVKLARELGERVGRELQLPVFLYEAAASSPARRNLAEVRRGEYERLKEEIGQNPQRIPDYGPSILTPAGAVIIGARGPLIAFNVFLESADPAIAKTIARRIRASNGGLPALKALGMLTAGRAQVSMNLTDYYQTSLFAAVEAVRQEAERLGTAIHHSELVGLVPQAALESSAAQALHLENWHSSQILENRLQEAISVARLPGFGFLEALSQPMPDPAGGAAGAFSAAQAAALVTMCARLALRSASDPSLLSQLSACADQAAELTQTLYRLMQKDVQAYTAFSAALHLPKTTPQEVQARRAASSTAALNAIRVPLAIARHALEVLTLTIFLSAHVSRSLLADLGTAANLSRAALNSAVLNIQANHPWLPKDEQSAVLLAEADALAQAGQQSFASLEDVLREKGSFRI